MWHGITKNTCGTLETKHPSEATISVRRPQALLVDSSPGVFVF